MKKAKRNINRQKSQRGSASVLVIMLSLTLVVFGVFSMMSAHAGLAVARRHGEWNTKHYEVESRAALVAAEIHQLVEVAAQEASGGQSHEVDLLEQEQHMIKSLEANVVEKKLPVTFLRVADNAKNSPMVLQAEINIVPPPEERSGFYGVLEFIIDLSNNGKPQVMVHQMVWKGVTEAFEYREGIEFRDVEVEGQVE